MSGDIQFEHIQENVQSADHHKSLHLISSFLQRNVVNSNLSEQEKIRFIQQIIYLLLKSKIDINLKKGGLKCVMNLPKVWHFGILDEISRYLGELPSDISNDTAEVYSLFENVTVFLAKSPILAEFFDSNFFRVAFLYNNVVENLLVEISHEPIKVKEVQIAKTLHFLSQTMIVFVDESCKHKTSITFPHVLYESIRRLMSCRKLCVNTINNCGLLIVTLDYNFFIMTSTLEHLEQLSHSSPIECLAICHGYLASPSFEFFIEASSHYCKLPVFILDVIWNIYVRYMNDSLMIISILKIALLFAKKVMFKKHEVPYNCTQHLIHLLLSHLDHFLNSAKNLSKEALIQLIRQGDEFVILEALHYVKSIRRADRKVCITLTALSRVIPYSRITCAYENVIEDILNAAKNSVSSSYICEAYVSLMVSNYNGDSVDSWFGKWIKPLLGSEDHSLLLEQVLLSASKLSSCVFQKIMLSCRHEIETNYATIVKCLLEIKKNAVPCATELSNFSDLNLNSNYWKGLLPLKVMKQEICVPNSMNALRTANLLIESNKGRKVLNFEEIELLKLFIDSQIAPEKSDFRHKFLNLLTQLFTKISTCCHYFTHSPVENKVFEYFDFVEWTVSYCINNLFAGASPERRFTALKILRIITEVNLWPVSKVEDSVMKTFFHCLNDPFEENKETAKIILISTFMPKENLMNDALKINLFREICEIIRGIRFSDHNSCAYFFEILCCTTSISYLSAVAAESSSTHLLDDIRNKKLRTEDSYFIHLQVLTSFLKSRLCVLKEENIVKYPVHGYLHVIRHLIKRMPLDNTGEFDILRWKALINEIVEVSVLCDTFAVSIVSHSSPEGYLPADETLATDYDNEHNAAQHLLLCNWRTVKEASLLLGHFAENFAICGEENGNAYLDKRTFLKIGSHLKDLIYKIRHKGSFKQVYIALFQYCKRCWRFPHPEINSLPRLWLKEIQYEIVHNGKQLCVTRRGAGIPCIVLAILCTEIDDQQRYTPNLLNDFMETMFDILSEKKMEIESKVHAMNILCDLFKHKDMAEEINNFIERAVIIAINGFKSTFWSERNTSNLLLSSILTRMFGVSRLRNEISWKNKMTGKMFFQKYPLLFDTFLDHLRQNEGEDISVQSALYPILLILARLYPSYHDEWNTTFQLNSFIPFIYNCSQNSIYKIRQLTVQAIVPFITRDNYVEHVNKIWSHLMLPLPENTKHGLLLQFDSLLKHLSELEMKDDHELLLILIKVLLEADSIVGGNHSFVVKENMIIILSRILQTHHGLIDLSKIGKYFIDETDIKRISNSPLNEQGYIAALQTFSLGMRYLILTDIGNVHEFVSLLENMIEKESAEKTSNIALDFIIKIVSEEKPKNENLILNNLIPNNSMKNDTRQAILKSKSIYRYLIRRLKNDTNIRLCETLLVLSEFLRKVVWEPSLIRTLSNFCKRHYNNSNLMIPFVTCMDILLEKLDRWDEDCFIIMQLLVSTSRMSLLPHQRRLRIFFFKYYNFHSFKDDEEYILNIWTFVGSMLQSIKEEEFIYFRQLLHNSSHEDHILSSKFIQAFCDTLQLKPLLCAVGLMSWIIKDMGVIFHDSEKNDVFFGDLPENFVDQLIISKLSQEYLCRLLKNHPNLMTEVIPETHLIWLLEQGNFKRKECPVSSLRDLVFGILRKFETIELRFSSSSFLMHETVEQQIISSKLSFLNSLPKM